jgi:DNA-binding CsgD family transcriptional regulator
MSTRLLFLLLFNAVLAFSYGASAQQPSSLEREIRGLISSGQVDSAASIYEARKRLWSELRPAQRAELELAQAMILYHQDAYTEAVSTAKEALQLAGDVDPYLAFRIRSLLADAYRQDYQMDSMKAHLDILLAQEQYGDSASLAKNYLGMYQYHYRGEDKDIALAYIQKARDYMAGIGNMEHAAMFDSYIGRLYQDLDNDSLSKYYQDRALDYLLAHDHVDKASHVLLERGSYYNGKGEFALAEQDLLECIRLSEQTGNLSNVANASQFISSAYVVMGRFKEAEEAIDRSMEICDQYDIEICRVYAHMYYAHLFHESGDMERAIFHAKKLSEYPTDQYSEEVWEGLGLLSKSYAGAGEYELAYDAKVAEMALADSLFNLEKEEAMGKLREQYEREKNQVEINELKNQAKIERLKRNGLITGLGIVLLLSAFALNREVQRRKKARALLESQLEVEQLEKLRLEETIAHKNRELTAKALHIAQKNEVLQKLQDDLRDMAEQQGATECVREVVNTLKLESTIDKNWEQFTQQFTELNPDFYKNINQVAEKLSRSDLRLAALLRMNMSSKEIANMLNISDEGIKKARYRLRKKLALQSDESLEAKIMAI